MTTPLDIARAHWPKPLPDWVEVLANKCADMTQREVGARIGYSAGMVSQLLRNRYRGNLAAIEEAVRGAWMGAKVTCPVMGSIPTSNHRARMHRACNSCPRNEKGTP